jgi:hypothetical protein
LKKRIPDYWSGCKNIMTTAAAKTSNPRASAHLSTQNRRKENERTHENDSNAAADWRSNFAGGSCEQPTKVVGQIMTAAKRQQSTLRMK